MKYDTTKWVDIRFERDTRYYLLLLQQDLFGQWFITKINGQISTQLGKSRDECYETYDEAVSRFIVLIRYRIKRQHYRIVSCQPNAVLQRFTSF